MPQFYFDTRGEKKGLVSDQVGQIFPSIIEARAHALTMLPVVGVELPFEEGEYRSWTVVVRNEADEMVCRFIMAIINDRLESGAGRVLRPMPN